MTKQEKLDIKLLMTGIRGSLFPEQWDNIVQEFPFVLQDDEDIDDDAITIEDVVVTSDSPVIRGRESIKRKSQLAQDNDDMYLFTIHVKNVYGVPFAPIDGIAQGHEKYVGFYVHSKSAFYRPFSANDGAISFASNEDEAAYLRSLGYVPFKELKDAESND